jgi:hypothetical protein
MRYALCAMRSSARFLHRIQFDLSISGRVFCLGERFEAKRRLGMKVSELCKTCKYATVLAHGMRCRKKMRVRYVNGKYVCAKYRMSKRYQTDSIFS